MQIRFGSGSTTLSTVIDLVALSLSLSYLDDLADARPGDCPPDDHDRVEEDDRHLGAPGVPQAPGHDFLPGQDELKNVVLRRKT